MDKAALDLLAKCHILHIEPSVKLTEALEGMLREDGILNIQHIASTQDVAAHPLSLETDILLIDFDHDVDAGIDLVRDIRMGRQKADPFLLTIGMQSDTDSRLVKQEARVGLDVILKKPFSTADLIDHIAPFATKPRRFALSKNYVGPDRRGKERLGAEGDIHIVPNRLKLRAGDRFTVQDAEHWLLSWRQMVEDMEAGRMIVDRLPISFFDSPVEELIIPKL